MAKQPIFAWERFWLCAGLLGAGAVAALLAGCSYTLPPPSAPTPEDIYALETSIAANHDRPKDYLAYGTALAAKNCVGWFGEQISGASKNAALSTELGLGAMAAGVAGGPAGAATAAAMGFGVASLMNLQTNAPAGIDPIATYGLVRKVQQAWLEAAPVPTTRAEAYMLVENFAEKCQLPDIKMAIAEALSTAPVRAVQPGGSFGLLPSDHPPLPPTIVIGESAQNTAPNPAQAAEPRRRARAEQPVQIGRRGPKPQISPSGSLVLRAAATDAWVRQALEQR